LCKCKKKSNRKQVQQDNLFHIANQALLRVQPNYNSTLLFTVNQGIQVYLFTQTMPGTLPVKLNIIEPGSFSKSCQLLSNFYSLPGE